MDRQVTRRDNSTADATDDSPLTDRPRGGIDVFDSILVRQPIRAGHTEDVCDLLVTWANANRDGDVRTLLPVEEVNLVTLFLDRTSDDRTDALLWYVEVWDDDADAWATPDRTIRTASPLFETGLADYLTDSATVHADGGGGHRLITHATHPRRQQRYEQTCERPLIAPIAGDDLPIPVVVTTIPLKRGLTSRIVGRAVDFGNWLKGFDRVSDLLVDQTDTLEAEAMYTESLLLEPVGDRFVLHYYMETEDMDRLYEAYTESDNWEVRFSDWAMRRIFENPEDVLVPPLESDCEVLLHAVDPDRP